MKIYKITEASEYIGVSINTLKTLANNGKIKSFKTTGKHRRFHQDALDAYMGVEKEMYYVDTRKIYFSEREAQCAAQIAAGKCYKRIAKNLDLSHRTVELYVKCAKEKLNCDSRAELAKTLENSGFLARYEQKQINDQQKR